MTARLADRRQITFLIGLFGPGEQPEIAGKLETLTEEAELPALGTDFLGAIELILLAQLRLTETKFVGDPLQGSERPSSTR